MSNQDSGERAFPFFDRTTMNSPEYGMSLRDYFAGQAMIGQLAMTASNSDQVCAKSAYAMADAMLAERAK